VDIISYVKSFPLRTFLKGELLLSPGDDTDKLLIIRDGAVKLSSVDEAGSERLLSIAGRYDVVPTERLFHPVVNVQYFYTAFSDGSAYTVDKKDFLDKAAKDPNILGQIARGLSEHHDDLLSRLNGVEQSHLRMKILFMLDALCTKFAASDVVLLHEIGLNLTHQDIADMVGATREATSIELKILLDEGLVEYSRSSFTVYASKVADEIKVPA
jgi:CRP-like cAMP-binding protein